MKGLIRVLVLLAILLAVAGLAGANAANPSMTAIEQTIATSPPLPPGEGPWVVRAYFSDPALPRQLAARLEPWEVHPEEGYLVAEVDRKTYEWMLSAGFRVEVDAKLTRQAQQPLIPLPGQASGVPAYPCYRTVEETYATAEQIAAGYPSLATWEDIGDSWEKGELGGLAGYDLQVLHLTNSAIPGTQAGAVRHVFRARPGVRPGGAQPALCGVPGRELRGRPGRDLDAGLYRSLPALPI